MVGGGLVRCLPFLAVLLSTIVSYYTQVMKYHTVPLNQNRNVFDTGCDRSNVL